MSIDRDRTRLEDMRNYAREAIEFLGDMTLDQLRSDTVKRYALIRTAEVVGEAASQLSKGFKRDHPNLAWRQAMGLRNELIHGYRGVDLAILTDTVRHDFPPLIAEIDRILAEGGRAE